MLYSLNKRNTLKQSQFIYIAPFKYLLYKIKIKPKINEVIKAEIIRVVVTATTIKIIKSYYISRYSYLFSLNHL